MKRLTAFLVAAAMLAMLLAGCSGTTSTPSSNPIGPDISDPAPTSDVQAVEYPEMTVLMSEYGVEYVTLPIQWFKEIVEKRTDGKITIEIHGNSELGNAKAHMELISTGVADGGSVTSLFSGAMALNNNIACIPFGIDDPVKAFEAAMAFVELHPELYAEWEAQNIHPVSMGACTDYGLISQKEITSPSDLSGLRIGCSVTSYTMALNAVGAVPTVTTAAENYQNYQNNVVDGGINPTSTVQTNKYYEVTNYFYDMHASWATVGTVIGFNLDFWNGLPTQVQELFDEVGYEVAARISEYEAGAKSEQIAEIATGSTVGELSDEFVSEWLSQMMDNPETNVIISAKAALDAAGYDGAAMIRDYVKCVEDAGFTIPLDVDAYL